MKTWTNQNTLLFVGILAFLGLSILLNYENRKLRADAKEDKNLVSALLDTVEVWKNKNGESMAKIQVLETQNVNAFLDLNANTQILKDLQALVKENNHMLKKGGSGTIVITETKVDTVVKTVVLGDGVFRGEFNDPWITIQSVSTKDTTSFFFKSRSELGLIIGEEKTGLFKTKPYAIVTDKNPHTSIKDLRVYQVSVPKPKRFIVGPSVGYGVMFTKNGIKTGVFVGGTFTYKLIGF